SQLLSARLAIVSLPPPALGEGCHCVLARCCIDMRRWPGVSNVVPPDWGVLLYWSPRPGAHRRAFLFRARCSSWKCHTGNVQGVPSSGSGDREAGRALAWRGASCPIVLLSTPIIGSGQKTSRL